MTNDYRSTYNKAKSILAQKYSQELHDIMKELGYVKKEKVIKDKSEAKQKKDQVNSQPVESKPEVDKIEKEVVKK